jgi:hypothetical protein
MLPPTANTTLEEPITMDELLQWVKNGRANKVPGRDGICLEFFRKTWETSKNDMPTVMNHIYVDGLLTEQQKQGKIVCLPKTSHATGIQVDDYRSLTLLNIDYKILARIIANRLRPWLAELLKPSQHCGLRGNTVFEAVAAVREAIAYAEVTNAPLCFVTIDFKEAFDKISHSYLFAMLRAYGFSERFPQRIQRM